jgi:putative transposase
MKEVPMQTMDVLKNKNEQDQTAGDHLRTKKEIEECVTFVRLELYNRDMPCGAQAVRERLEKFYHVKPLPSDRTIARILARHGLTHGRTGIYDW